MSRQRGRPWSSVRETLLSDHASPGPDPKRQLELKNGTFETHMKESGSHKCAFTCRVCGEGLNRSKVHLQSTCLYNEKSGQAYQSQAYHRNISCLTHWDLQNHCASLRGDAKLAWAYDVMHGLWEKQKPQASTQTKTKSSSIDAEYIGVQEERRQAMYSMYVGACLVREWNDIFKHG